MQTSTNITANFKMELLNLVKFDIEFEFVPLLIGISMEFYTTSAIGDNCVWPNIKIKPLNFYTRVTKNIAHCGKNLFSIIEEAPDWTSLPERFTNGDYGLGLLLELLTPHCQYDEQFG